MSLEVQTTLRKVVHLYAITDSLLQSSFELLSACRCHVTCTNWGKVVQTQLFKTRSSLWKLSD